MTRKYKNFFYQLTPRPATQVDDTHLMATQEDVLLHIAAQPDAPHMYSNIYPDSAAAIAAAEDWIESAHRTVLDYYRGGSKG